MHSTHVSSFSKTITVGVPETGIGELVVVGILVGGNGVVVGSGVAEGGNVAVGVAVGIAVCVSATIVFAIDRAVSIISVGFVLGAGRKLLQEVNIITTRSNKIITLRVIFISVLFMFCKETPNGLRYPQVGGRGQCLRCRKNSKPEKCS